MKIRLKRFALLAASVAILHFAATCLAWWWWDSTSIATGDPVPVWIKAPWFAMSFPFVLLINEAMGRLKEVTFAGGVGVNIFLLEWAFNSLAWGAVIATLLARRTQAVGASVRRGDL